MFLTDFWCGHLFLEVWHSIRADQKLNSEALTYVEFMFVWVYNLFLHNFQQKNMVH